MSGRAFTLSEKRGLSRDEAASYVGVSPGTFDAMVEDGRMPKPKPVNRRKVWDRIQLDAHFDALPNEGDKRRPKVDWRDVRP